MTDYKPGTVAKATVRGVPNVTVMLDFDGSWYVPEPDDVNAESSRQFYEDVTDVRPLIVLDPSDPAVAEFVNFWKPDGGVSFAGRLALLIEKQMRPTIEEPKGLGAVVEVDGGVRFVRDPFGVWRSEDESWAWSHLNAVRVLSEGVQP